MFCHTILLGTFNFDQFVEIIFLPGGVLPKRWSPACAQWCSHQPSQARRRHPLYRSPWPRRSGGETVWDRAPSARKVHQCSRLGNRQGARMLWKHSVWNRVQTFCTKALKGLGHKTHGKSSYHRTDWPRNLSLTSGEKKPIVHPT